MSNSKDSWRKRFMSEYSDLWRKGCMAAILIVMMLAGIAFAGLLLYGFILIVAGLFGYEFSRDIGNIILSIITILAIIFVVPYYCGCAVDMTKDIPYKKKEE